MTPRQKTLLLTATITLVALIPRLYVAHTTYLNPDEAIRLLAAAAGDFDRFQNPPVLYWWLRFAWWISEDVWWLRLLPVVAGALTPAAAALWLRRWVSPVTAWILALLLALVPNLIMLSAQLRAYSLVMAFTALSLWLLETALEDQSRSRLVLHFVTLWIAILSDVSMGWVVLACGLYGIARLARARDTTLLPAWIAGQGVAAALYVMLFFNLVVPLMRPELHITDTWRTFRTEAFPWEGQQAWRFILRGSLRQLVYVTGSEPAGWLAAAAFAAGLVRWTRRDWPRIVLVAAPFLAAFAAVLDVYPFGRTRHTVVIGFVALAAVGAGIDWAARGRRIAQAALAGALLVLALSERTSDKGNIPLIFASRAEWERGVTALMAATSPGDLFVVDEEASVMLRAEEVRRRRADPDFSLHQLEVLQWEWSDEIWKPTVLTARLAAVAHEREQSDRHVILIDAGFVTARLERFLNRAYREELVTIPGVLYAARLTR